MSQSPGNGSQCISYNKIPDEDEDDTDEASDDELKSIVFRDTENRNEDVNARKNPDDLQKGPNCEIEGNVTDTHVTDTCVTDTNTPNDITCSWLNHDEFVNTDEVTSLPIDNALSNDVEVVDICSQNSKEYDLSSKDILASTDVVTVKDIIKMKDSCVPECVLWPSILSALESCTDYNQLEALAMDLKDIIPDLKP